MELGICLFIIFVLAIVYARYIVTSNKRIWNDGRCRCGGKWNYFGMTYYGSRIYHCEYCDNEIIISELDC